tara:strand:- start:306 stop:977 length:672 start_codon:yes stop_codon:yes gene_type:complete
MAKGGLKTGSNYSSTYYKEPMHETAGFHYLLLILVLVSLAVSVFILLDTGQITGAVTGDTQTIDANDFLAKLTAHPEAQSYVGVSPLNIIQVNNNNLANLQTQIAGLDASFLGNFLVQYTDSIVIYDYNNNVVMGSISLQQPQQAALPGDFFTKLNAHAELAGLGNEQPTGGQIDQASLDTLMQQFPNVYGNAKVGDFLLRYSTILVIYDYNSDSIINAVALG